MCVNGYNSNNNPRPFAVPQGTAFGAIVVSLIHINLPKMARRISHFADDSNIYFCFKDLNVLERLLNSELKLVADWLRFNL